MENRGYGRAVFYPLSSFIENGFENQVIGITGVAGFLGWNLAQSWLAGGGVVLGLDNFITGQRAHVTDLSRRYPGRFHFAQGDVTQGLSAWSDFPPPKYIFHLASPASPTDFATLWREISLANTLGLLQVIDWANARATRVVFASTSEVYGNPACHPQTEDHFGDVNFHGPRGCYDESKRLGEALLFQATSQGAPHGVVRIFNTYGPGMRADDGRVVPSFFKQLAEENRIVVHGDGSQTRSFCFVSDLVRGLLLYAESGLREPVNLGSVEEVSVSDLAERIRRVFGNPFSRVIYSPRRKDDPIRRRPDLSRAVEKLNWMPTVSLADGLSFFAQSRFETRSTTDFADTDSKR